MTLKEMPKVGEKVRFISERYPSFMTEGKVYEVSKCTDERFVLIDDEGDDISWRGREYGMFELVDEGTPVEASPTVIELLANISRRLYEAEEALKLKNDEVSLLHDIGVLLRDRLFEVELQNREQAYEINELYKAVSQ